MVAQGLKDRRNLSGTPELGLKNAITHRENVDEYGHLVFEALNKVWEIPAQPPLSPGATASARNSGMETISLVWYQALLGICKPVCNILLLHWHQALSGV